MLTQNLEEPGFDDLVDFFSLEITPTDYLDIVESCGADVDEYLEIINENLYDIV
jgi:hypothetical protein